MARDLCCDAIPRPRLKLDDKLQNITKILTPFLVRKMDSTVSFGEVANSSFGNRGRDMAVTCRMTMTVFS